MLGMACCTMSMLHLGHIPRELLSSSSTGVLHLGQFGVPTLNLLQSKGGYALPYIDILFVQLTQHGVLSSIVDEYTTATRQNRIRSP